MFGKFTTILGFVMSLVFVTMGVLFLIYKIKLFSLTEPEYVSYLMGGILIVYGFFRFYRAYTQYQELK